MELLEHFQFKISSNSVLLSVLTILCIVSSIKERAEGLAEYIAVENSKGKKLFGGIVLREENSWRFNDSRNYTYDPNNLKDWKCLDLG